MSDTGNQNLYEMQLEVDRVKNVMQENVNKAVNRGQDLDELNSRADALNFSSQTFSKKAKQVKKKMWWQHKKTQAIAGVGGLLLLLIIIIIIASSVGSDSSTTTK